MSFIHSHKDSKQELTTQRNPHFNTPYLSGRVEITLFTLQKIPLERLTFALCYQIAFTKVTYCCGRRPEKGCGIMQLNSPLLVSFPVASGDICRPSKTQRAVIHGGGAWRGMEEPLLGGPLTNLIYCSIAVVSISLKLMRIVYGMVSDIRCGPLFPKLIVFPRRSPFPRRAKQSRARPSAKRGQEGESSG